MKTKKMLGISLIILVITMIVMIILATATAMIITNDNPIDRAKKVKLQNDLSAIRENVQLYINKKYNETNGAFKKEQLTADKSGFTYNDGIEEKTDSFLDIIGEEYESYEDKVWIDSGELVYNETDENSKKWIEEIGIRTSGVLIENGVLKNLWEVDGLIDSEGVLRIPSIVKEISPNAFGGITKDIKKVIIPGTCKVIGEYAFFGTNIQELVIEEGTTTIGQYAFSKCTKLTKVVLPSTIKVMYNRVFSSCSELVEVNLENTQITSIGEGLFYQCVKLTNLHLPDTITKILGASFSSCRALKSINIPANVSTIDASAFAGCSNLNEVLIDEKNQTFKCKDGFLMNYEGTQIKFIFPSTFSGKEEFSIPEGVTGISDQIPTWYYNIKRYKIPASVKGIGVSFQWFPNLEEFIVDDANETFSTINGSLYSKNGKVLYAYLSKDTSIVLDEGVEETRSYNFNNCRKATSIKLPSSLKTIGPYTFYNSKFTSVNIPAGVTSIGGTFKYYSSIKKVIVDPGNTTYKILNNLLVRNEKTVITYANEGDTIIEIPEGIKYINEYAFYNNNTVTQINLPSSLVSIGQRAFVSCNKLSSLTIPSSVTSIGAQAFQNCSGFKR